MATAATTEAVLLRRYRFADSGLVLVWLSSEHGKIRTALRSSRSRDGQARPVPDLFYHAEILFAPNRKSDLATLREWKLLEARDPLRGNYVKLLAASYFAELCDLFSEPGHSSTGLFDLLQRALGHLCVNLPTRRAVEFFELETCRVLGFGHDGNALGAIESHAGRVPANRRRLLGALN